MTDYRRLNWAHSVLNDPGAKEYQKRAARAVIAKNGESPRSIWEDGDSFGAEVREDWEPQ